MGKTALRRIRKRARRLAATFNALHVSDPSRFRDRLGLFVATFEDHALARARRPGPYARGLVWDLMKYAMPFAAALRVPEAERDILLEELREICRCAVASVMEDSGGRLPRSRHVGQREICQTPV
jgi:hypothetical protein